MKLRGIQLENIITRVIKESHENSGRLLTKMRKEINKYLYDISTHSQETYYDKIPLQDIFDVLMSHEIVPIQEDNTKWDGFLLGVDGRVNFDLAFKNSSYDEEGQEFYLPIKNSTLILSWHKMPQSGRYEINSYVS